MEKLEFGLRWESIRLAYFESLGWEARTKEQTRVIEKIQLQLNELYSGS